MSNVPHPRHLFPSYVRVRFNVKCRIVKSQIPAFIQFLINEYFDKSVVARQLWHDHAEGMLTDQQWVGRTLEEFESYANKIIKESNL